MRDPRVDVLVVGGGLGGVAAARAAAESGARVLLCEETDWLGGQLTQQGVPLDEHPWIERFGCTARYRQLRDGLRQYYRDWYPLSPAARADPELNPGAGRVGKVCVEPRVGVAVLEAMLAPLRGADRLEVLLETRAVGVEVDDDRVAAVALEDLVTGDVRWVEPAYVLDASETGEVLPLARAEYVTGFESRSATGEPHAPESAQPANMQAVTHCFAFDHVEGADFTADRPAGYERWLREAPAGWPGPFLAWEAADPKTGLPRRHRLSPNPPVGGERPADLREEGGADDLWTFRRIAYRGSFVEGAYASDLVIANWPMMDYVAGPVLESDDAEAHRAGARDLSASVLHWLRTEAPRLDGGVGYPGLRLRPDVLGTDDGFAKRAYIRESRRIRALTTVVEQDIAFAERGERGPVLRDDSVGVGCYRIDLHPSTGGDPYIDIPAWPFQIPLGALLPVRLRNLLPAGKNLGTTHVTNGCFRLHPVEWNVGEVAGELAAHCVSASLEPQGVHGDPEALAGFQRLLAAKGVELDWPSVRPY